MPLLTILPTCSFTAEHRISPETYECLFKMLKPVHSGTGEICLCRTSRCFTALKHLQNIYRVSLNKLHTSLRISCLRGERSTHKVLPGGLQLNPTPSYALFFFSFLVPDGSGSGGYFRGPPRSANLSPTFAEFPPDWGELGSRTKSYGLTLSLPSSSFTAPHFP